MERWRYTDAGVFLGGGWTVGAVPLTPIARMTVGVDTLSTALWIISDGDLVKKNRINLEPMTIISIFVLQQKIYTMSQTLTLLIIHVVFHKKTSSPTIRETDLHRLNRFVQEACRQLQCPCLIANGPGDHLHMLVSLSPTHSLSDLVKEIKRTSTIFLKQCDADYYATFHWQGGYGAFSVSCKLKDAVYQYIARQQEHHHRQSSSDEFRALLHNANIKGFEDKFYWQ